MFWLAMLLIVLTILSFFAIALTLTFKTSRKEKLIIITSALLIGVTSLFSSQTLIHRYNHTIQEEQKTEAAVIQEKYAITILPEEIKHLPLVTNAGESILAEDKNKKTITIHVYYLSPTNSLVTTEKELPIKQTH